VFPSHYVAKPRIDPSSPSRKRRRMSSPTYDDQLAFPSQDELRAIGQFETSLSQAPSRYRESANTVPGVGTSSQDSFGLEVCTIHKLLASQLPAEPNDSVTSAHPTLLIDPNLPSLQHHFHDNVLLQDMTILTIHSHPHLGLLRGLPPLLPQISSIQ